MRGGRITQLAYRLSGQPLDTPVISNATWYPFGPVQQLTYANGRTLTRTYDKDYVIASVLSNGAGGLDYSFGRDAVGNLTQLLSTAASNNFLYDGLDRLTGVNALNNSLIAAYTYNSTGDRLSKQTMAGTQAYTYPSTSHRLSNVAATARTYDGAGNTTAIGAQALIYDATSRLKSVNNGPVVIKQYDYNATGERVRKYLGSATDAFYISDESGHLLGDYDTNTARLHDYLWLDDLPVGVLTGATGTLAYIEPDHLGTPRAAVDPARNVAIWKWPLSNDAFGESAPQQDPDGDGTQFVLNLRMPGQYFDVESGLSYNYFRDYEAGTGRYTQPDPIGLGGGTSVYGYVGANPMKFFDPYGLSKTDQWFGFNNRNFQWWFHNCYKQAGDPDVSSRAEMAEIYAEYQAAGSPPIGKCSNGPKCPPEPAPSHSPSHAPPPDPLVTPPSRFMLLLDAIGVAIIGSMIWAK